MRLTCLGSGSSGNCFLLEDSGRLLILDAGVKFDKILACKRLTSFSRVDGALVTHKHKDHCLCVPELIKAGVGVYSPDNFVTKRKYTIGEFIVLPFLCHHDIENYGYVIRCPSGATVVYATDTAALPRILHVDVWIVECNYTERLWDENVAKADAGFRYFGRVKECHMGLETLQAYFDALQASTAAIILTHLSENGNADAEAMKAAMTPYADIVDVAFAKKEWDFA